MPSNRRTTPEKNKDLAWTSSGSTLDSLIEQGEFSRAQQEQLPPPQEIEGNLHLILAQYRRHIAHISIPSHQRLHQSFSGEPQPPRLDQDLSSLYGLYASLLESIYQRPSWPKDHPATREHIQGVLTEITFLAILSRSTTGAKATEDLIKAEEESPQHEGIAIEAFRDRYITTPNTTLDDVGDIREDGVRTGIDFTITDRITNNQIEVQAKTSDLSVRNNPYREGIMMLSLERIAGGTKNIPALRQAILNETDGTASTEEERLLDAAELRLYRKIAKRFSAQEQRIEKLTKLGHGTVRSTVQSHHAHLATTQDSLSNP